MLKINNLELSSFKTANEFSLFIEKQVVDNKNLTHVDAIIKYCTDNQVDEDDIKHLINKSLMAKLRSDFINMNLIKKQTTTLNF